MLQKTSCFNFHIFNNSRKNYFLFTICTVACMYCDDLIFVEIIGIILTFLKGQPRFQPAERFQLLPFYDFGELIVPRPKITYDDEINSLYKSYL